MKIFLFFVLIGTMVSCTTVKGPSSVLRDDDFPITRKYIGNFVDYCHTGPEVFGGVNLIWIKPHFTPLLVKFQHTVRIVIFQPGIKFI
jgi:hypothetical protein